MVLTGKLVTQICIKSDANVFHELVRDTPHQFPGIAPDKVHTCDLHDGQWGTVGSIIYWEYLHEGKKCVAKEIIEAIDEEKKSVTFKVIEGDVMELYEAFKLCVHVDTNGEDNLVTWTVEYEKKSEDVPDPHTIMELFRSFTKDIDNYHLSNPAK